MSNLPENPSLDHLRRQARTLLRQFRAADADAVARVREHHPRPHDPLRLADAQLVVARSYGFASWPALRRHMDVVGRFARSPHTVPPSADGADELLRLGCVRYGGDSRADQARAAALLAEHPPLSRATPYTAAATELLIKVRSHNRGPTTRVQIRWTHSVGTRQCTPSARTPPHEPTGFS